MRFKDDNDNRYRVNFTRATEAHIDKMTVAEFIEYLENNAEFEDERTPIYIDGKTIWCKDCILKETYKLRKEFLVSEDGSRLFYSISVTKRAELVDDSTEAAADNAEAINRKERRTMAGEERRAISTEKVREKSTYTQFEKRLKEDIKTVKRARAIIGDDCITREAYTKYDALHMLACDLALCNSIDELKKQVRADSNDLPNDVYKQMQQYIEQNVNGVMDIWNMAHVDDGDKYYIRKEYTEVSELDKHNKEPQPVITTQQPQQTEPTAGQGPEPQPQQTGDGQQTGEKGEE